MRSPGTYVMYMQATESTFGINPNGSTTGSIDNVSVVECSNVVEIPRLEGTWKQRWLTEVPTDVWNTNLPNPLTNGGATPASQFSADVTKRWQGETWDIGVTLTAQFQMVPNVDVLSGAVAYYIETSNDGSTWTRQLSGTSFNGTTRMLRPVIEAVPVAGSPTVPCSFRVNEPVAMSVAALSRPEDGFVTTSASAPVLVQLTNNYIAASALQVTAVMNVGDSATDLGATYDRLLLSTVTGLCLQADCTSAVNPFLQQEILSAAYTIQSPHQPPTNRAF
jgi:hypothetical protein